MSGDSEASPAHNIPVQPSDGCFSLHAPPLLSSDWPADVGALTVVAGKAPAAGHTLHASGEVVSGFGHTHRGNTHVHLCGAGQLDEQDVVVDGESVVAGVLEHLTGNDSVRTGEHMGRQYDEMRS